MPLHPPGADPARTMEEDLEQLVTLDRLGFEEAWIGEHFTAMWENIPCPDLFIANALARTQTIKLGTGVSCLPNHNPLMLAQRIAQLDQMARGRFYWGVGSGGFPGDFEMCGLDPKSGEQRGITRAGLDLGRERGYIPMSINFVPPRILRTHWASVEEGAARTGRVADRSTWRIARDVYVADTNARARREALEGPLARDYRDYFLPLLGKIRGREMLKIDPAMPDADVTLEYLLDNIWIVGDPDTVAARLAKLGDEVGGFGTLLVIAHEGRPRAAWERSMVLLQEQVLPRVAA